MALWDAIKRLARFIGGIPEAPEKRAEELRIWMEQSDAKAEAALARLDRIRWQERPQTLLDLMARVDALQAKIHDLIREEEAERAAEDIAGRG
jgi:hypothetical protein